MSPSINTDYAVIVLGDQETIRHFDLVGKAAGQGAVVVATYGFESGETRAQDDLTAVDAVVTALSRAIATRTDIWVPFPLDDLGREEHVRRISLVLQRHGLNMLMGHDLEPCTMDGGFNPIDYALRLEVRAVDELGFAALAAAGIRTLGAEMEVELNQAAERASDPVSQQIARPLDGAEKTYGTGEVARFFGKSLQWLYWGMRSGAFTREDGSLIEPARVGKNGRRRFTLPVLRDMARSCYRSGTLSEDELLDLLAVLARAESE